MLEFLKWFKRKREKTSPAAEELSTAERREKPETERLRKIVLWSFFASQGDPELQRIFLSNVVRIHPELIDSMQAWANELKFEERLEEKRVVGTETEDSGSELTFSIDPRALELHPSGPKLIADVKRIVSGDSHPKGSVPKPDSPDFYPEVLAETSRRVADLFKTALPALYEGKEPVYHSIENCTDRLVRRDTEWMVFYEDLEEQIVHDLELEPAQRAQMTQRIQARREFIGVSLLCKYGLSEKRVSAVPILAPEIQEVFEEVGKYVRSNRERYLAPVVSPGGESRPSDLRELLDYWKKETDEEIML